MLLQAIYFSQTKGISGKQNYEEKRGTTSIIPSDERRKLLTTDGYTPLHRLT